MKVPTQWTGPADIRAAVDRQWKKGRILSAPLRGEHLFPMRVPLKAPTGPELSARFDEVRRWIRELVEGSRETKRFGYEIEWLEIDHRQLGLNRVPAAVMVPSEEDALA